LSDHQGPRREQQRGECLGIVEGRAAPALAGRFAWIEPGSFVYPLKQKWFAGHTQMANEPSYVDGGEAPGNKKIYYHYGLDSGGAEGMVDVVAATAGRVISSGTNILAGYDDSPAKPRYDVIYLLDDRGWFYRYSHLQTIDPAVRPGAQISMGQKIGVLGKEGGSGGWSHLHLTSRAASHRAVGHSRGLRIFVGNLPTPILAQTYRRGPAASFRFRRRQSRARRLEILERVRRLPVTTGRSRTTTASSPTVARTYVSVRRV